MALMRAVGASVSIAEKAGAVLRDIMASGNPPPQYSQTRKYSQTPNAPLQAVLSLSKPNQALSEGTQQV